MTDEMVEKCLSEAHQVHGFTGLVGWHYYNEPMLEHARIFDLMERHPNYRYVLWTNGTIQPDDQRLTMFERVWCSDYTGIDRSYFDKCGWKYIFNARFDNRLLDTKDMPTNPRVCLRQHLEFVVDAWGSGRFCCQDWRGEIFIGNIWEEPFKKLLERRYQVLVDMKEGREPDRCRRCPVKVRLPKFDRASYKRAARWLAR